MENFEPQGQANPEPGNLDWLNDLHPERSRAINEMLKRADFGHRPFGRVSAMVRTYPSTAERFRDEIAKSPPPWLLNRARLKGLDPALSKSQNPEARRRRRLTRDLLSTLSPNVFALSSRARAPSENGSIKDTLDYISNLQNKLGGRHAENYTDHRNRSLEELKRLLKLYEPDGPLAPPDELPSQRGGDGRADLPPLSPYPPGDAAYKYWLNLWRETPESPISAPLNTDREQRLVWEGYFERQHFTTWEDFSDEAAARQNDFIENRGDSLALNTHCTAFHGLLNWLDAWKSEVPSFDWHGQLLSLTHVWSVPIELIVPDLGSDDILQVCQKIIDEKHYSPDVMSVLSAVQAFAQRSFPQRDQTRIDGERDDLVISVLGHCEALLVCDFRPYSLDSDKRERADRILVIPLTAGPDKLGRMIRRVLDISAYRMLALKDYQYSFPIRDVLTDISAEISRQESAHHKDQAKKNRRSISDRLDRWQELSTRLAAVNHFVTDGITSVHSASVEYRQLVRDNLDDLRESAIPGYQTLTSYMRRFESSVTFLSTVHSKYQALRVRLDEMVNLSRAEFQSLETKRTARRAIIALFISLMLLTLSAVNAWPRIAEVNIQDAMNFILSLAETASSWIMSTLRSTILSGD